MAQSTKQPLENWQAYQTLLITLFDAAKASAGLADKAASLLYEAQCRIEDAAELYSEAHIHAEKATTYLYAAIDECRAYIRDDDDPHAIKPSPPNRGPSKELTQNALRNWDKGTIHTALFHRIGINRVTPARYAKYPYIFQSISHFPLPWRGMGDKGIITRSSLPQKANQPCYPLPVMRNTHIYFNPFRIFPSRGGVPAAAGGVVSTASLTTATAITLFHLSRR